MKFDFESDLDSGSSSADHQNLSFAPPPSGWPAPRARAASPTPSSPSVSRARVASPTPSSPRSEVSFGRREAPLRVQLCFSEAGASSVAGSAVSAIRAGREGRDRTRKGASKRVDKYLQDGSKEMLQQVRRMAQMAADVYSDPGDDAAGTSDEGDEPPDPAERDAAVRERIEELIGRFHAEGRAELIQPVAEWHKKRKPEAQERLETEFFDREAEQAAEEVELDAKLEDVKKMLHEEQVRSQTVLRRLLREPERGKVLKSSIETERTTDGADENKIEAMRKHDEKKLGDLRAIVKELRQQCHEHEAWEGKEGHAEEERFAGLCAKRDKRKQDVDDLEAELASWDYRLFRFELAHKQVFHGIREKPGSSTDVLVQDLIRDSKEQIKKTKQNELKKLCPGILEAQVREAQEKSKMDELEEKRKELERELEEYATLLAAYQPDAADIDSHDSAGAVDDDPEVQAQDRLEVQAALQKAVHRRRILEDQLDGFRKQLQTMTASTKVLLEEKEVVRKLLHDTVANLLAEGEPASDNEAEAWTYNSLEELWQSRRRQKEDAAKIPEVFAWFAWPQLFAASGTGSASQRLLSKSPASKSPAVAHCPAPSEAQPAQQSWSMATTRRCSQLEEPMPEPAAEPAPASDVEVTRTPQCRRASWQRSREVRAGRRRAAVEEDEAALRRAALEEDRIETTTQLFNDTECLKADLRGIEDFLHSVNMAGGYGKADRGSARLDTGAASLEQLRKEDEAELLEIQRIKDEMLELEAQLDHEEFQMRIEKSGMTQAQEEEEQPYWSREPETQELSSATAVAPDATKEALVPTTSLLTRQPSQVSETGTKARSVSFAHEVEAPVVKRSQSKASSQVPRPPGRRPRGAGAHSNELESPPRSPTNGAKPSPRGSSLKTRLKT